MLRAILFVALTAAVVVVGQLHSSAQVLPDNPTSSDIKALLTQASLGAVDPQQVIASLSKPDGRYVSVMRELLFAERLNSGSGHVAGETTRILFNPIPARRILIKALESVGSADCYSCFHDAVVQHPDPQIRGLCLSSIANAFQIRALSGVIKPDKELIYLFLSQASDTLAIEDLGKRVGDIAREGIKNWTAKGGSRPITATLRAEDVNKSVGSRPYWEYWWSKRSSKITWDPKTGLFVMPV